MKYLISIITLFFSLNSYSENLLNPANSKSSVKAEIVTDRDIILLSSKLHENIPKIGILFTLEDGWHIYGQDPGDAGQPTKISFSVQEKNNISSTWKISTPKWPETETFLEKGDITTYGYSKKVLASSTINPPPIIETNESEIIIRAEVSWLACLDRCVPGKATLEKSILVSSSAAEEAPKNTLLFETQGRNNINTVAKDESRNNSSEDNNKPIWLILISAFLGGMILNLMPCVLPVLSLKVFSLVNISGCSKTKKYNDLSWFVFGILISFNILAIFVTFLKKIGEPVGWGFQFQNINFVYFVTILIFILSLKFFNIKLPGIKIHQNCADYLEKQKLKNAKMQNLVDGILITLLSTPCTAPLLGTAVGFALSQSPTFTFIIFNTIGIGLATPFILLTSNERALKLLPKPGPWMDSFREVLGLAMLGTVIWLITVQDSILHEGNLNTLILLFIIFCLVKFYGFVEKKFFKSILIICTIFTAFYFLPSKHEEISNWIPYSETAITESTGPVFLDFTASWCITCKYNEKFILSTSQIKEEFKKHNVKIIKADWSDGSPEISEALSLYGGNGVPHYVLIDNSKGIKEVLPTVLTRNIVKEYLNKLLAK